MQNRSWFVRFTPAVFGVAIIALAALCGQKQQSGNSGAVQSAVDSMNMTNKTAVTNAPMGTPDTVISTGKKNTVVKGTEAGYYTCPMHPQIHAAKPGKCPICGMDLVFTNPAQQKPFR